jgi:hypothetical protein
MKALTYISLIIVLLFACKKPENRKCYKFLGENSTKRIELKNFTRLKLKKNIVFELVQDDSTYLIVKGGKNVVNFIKTEFDSDGFLHVFNENKCDFLRNQKEKITVEIHFVNLEELFFEVSEKLTCRDTLKLNDFNFTILDACGTMDLLINAQNLKGEVAYGWGDYFIAGKVNNADLGVRSNGYCDVSNLKVIAKYNLKNESPGNMYVNVSNNEVIGMISGAGNIYYQGEPASTTINFYGKGKFLPY